MLSKTNSGFSFFVLIACAFFAMPSLAQDVDGQYGENATYLFSSDGKDSAHLLEGSDFSFNAWGSGSVIDEMTEDANFNAVLQVQPGQDWGALTSTLAFTGLQPGFISPYKSLAFKAKGMEDIYVKFSDNADPQTGTEIAFDLGAYGKPIEGAEGWYQVSVPLSEFPDSQAYTEFAIHSGWSQGETIYVTDVALSHEEAQLAEVVEQHETQTDMNASLIPVFNGNDYGVWKSYVGDEGMWNMPVTEGSGISVHEELEVQPITYQNIGDSRQITWSGKGIRPSQFYWQAGMPMDFSSMKEKDGALAMIMRVDKAPNGDVGLRMDCGYPCLGELDMTPLFKNVPEGQWFTIGVKISCFEKAGANLSQVLSPFLLATDRSFTLSIHQIAVLEGLPEQQLLPC